jgi:hypothetical protein
MDPVGDHQECTCDRFLTQRPLDPLPVFRGEVANGSRRVVGPEFAESLPLEIQHEAALQPGLSQRIVEQVAVFDGGAGIFERKQSVAPCVIRLARVDQ